MYPEDRVLVSVINRKRDLDYARNDRWYRIPQQRFMRDSIHTEYVAFFLSRAFGERNGGIHYFAPVKGYELAYRRDLLPRESPHPRDDDVYFRLALGDLEEKQPPVINTTRRTIAFIFTTWDRFVKAERITDLYSQSDYFVDRIYHALRDHNARPIRLWSAERKGAGVRILCDGGVVTAATEQTDGALYIDETQTHDAILAAIKQAIAQNGGPVTVGIPLEGT